MRKVLIPLDGENAGPLRIGSFCALSVEMVREVSWSLLERLEVSLVEGRVIGPVESRGVSWRTDVPLDGENAGPLRIGSFCALRTGRRRKVPVRDWRSHGVSLG